MTEVLHGIPQSLKANDGYHDLTPTSSFQVRARVSQVGFVVDKVALEQVFSEYFCFPRQYSFHQILHHYHNHLGQVQ
jgi:hypothetical protein